MWVPSQIGDFFGGNFFREILYENIAITAAQHSEMHFVDTFGDFSHTVEWNSLKSVWRISLYILV